MAPALLILLDILGIKRPGEIIMNNLKLYSTQDINEINWPENSTNYNLHSPALCFFTDFTKTTPMVIEPSTPVIDVKKLMQKAHVRLQMILDKNEQFIGIITDEDVIERKIVQKTSKDVSREEVTVVDLMTPKKELMALDFDEISSCNIAAVITVLKDNGQRHSLVIDRESNKIRGIFSASDISRKLHLEVDIQDNPSFAKVFSQLS